MLLKESANGQLHTADLILNSKANRPLLQITPPQDLRKYTQNYCDQIKKKNIFPLNIYIWRPHL